MIKLLIGGSPCTHWSIAQSKNRETTAEGIGWELFKNYITAKEKFQPDFFLYENNWSASKEIKSQIEKELGCDLMRINSRLVSAQNRDRFYVFNWTVEQPEDRGIILRDILETGEAYLEKSYVLKAQCSKTSVANMFSGHFAAPMVAEPVRIGTIENKAKNQSQHDSKQYRVYSPDGKSVTICGEGGGLGAKTGLYAIPVTEERIGAYPNQKGELTDCQSKRIYSTNGKGRCLQAGLGGLGVQTGLYAVPVDEAIRIGAMPNSQGRLCNSQSKRIYSVEGKSKTLCASSSGGNSDLSSPSTGLYAVPCGVAYRGRPDENGKNVKRFEGGGEEKANCLTTVQTDSMVAEPIDKNVKRMQQTIYQVEDGQIEIKGKNYPIKLQDGYYIIRKLTPVECERLQTLPDGYTAAVSNTQRYKGLGNGWTAEVIIHILQGALKDVPRDEKIVVLSMYDGIATGRYCLDKMGFTNIEYHAYEIDKYAMKVAMSNYPDIIQHGDAFQVRNDDWSL